MKSRSPGFHRSDLPTGNPQSKSDGAIIEQRPFTVNDTLASPEKLPPRLPLRESPMGSCHRDGTFAVSSQAPGLRIPLTRSCYPCGRPEVIPAHACNSMIADPTPESNPDARIISLMSPI
jgi:hypothetical protein